MYDFFKNARMYKKKIQMNDFQIVFFISCGKLGKAPQEDDLYMEIQIITLPKAAPYYQNLICYYK